MKLLSLCYTVYGIIRNNINTNKDIDMRLLDRLQQTGQTKEKTTIPDLDGSATAWMKQLQEWRATVIQAEIAFNSASDDSDAYSHYHDAVYAIDPSIGEYAEHIASHPPATFEANGYTKDKSDIWRPHEKYILIHAIDVFDHIRTDNSRALVEALLYKYADERWWPQTNELKIRYQSLLKQHEEQTDSSIR